ncbi:uncharacterized protein LOC132316163 [Cornus florida]|uniref:uncharacterized protein LOC132316163 n=1 Tax=Cornus florida TaxID=4283 RepID=UPI00289C9917|nr:uncharacterized protein LOC132316163 [Cornus florida]
MDYVSGYDGNGSVREYIYKMCKLVNDLSIPIAVSSHFSDYSLYIQQTHHHIFDLWCQILDLLIVSTTTTSSTTGVGDSSALVLFCGRTAFFSDTDGGEDKGGAEINSGLGIEAKQPNFAMRKSARVQLIKNGKKIAAFVPNDGEFVFALFLDETLSKEPLLSHDLDDQQMYRAKGVIGPFNGILGLWDWNDIALLNPATREFRFLDLSVPDTNLPPYFDPYYYSFGFGLDRTTNDYKVVWIRDFWDDKNDIPYNPRVVSVYTLGTDSWRVFEIELSQIHTIQDPLCNAYKNGFYYWLDFGDIHYLILSFDMDNEVFRVITVRDVPTSNIPKSRCAALSMYNDSIAIFLYDLSGVEKHFDIWSMEEDECWTKQLTIGPILDVERPLVSWKNGELFLERRDTAELVLYNHNTGETKYFRQRGKDAILKPFIYQESLVSVFGRK